MEDKKKWILDDKSKEALRNAGWIDWNELSLEEMARHLEEKYRFSSSGDAHAIYRLVEFYDKHKNNDN